MPEQSMVYVVDIGDGVDTPGCDCRGCVAKRTIRGFHEGTRTLEDVEKVLNLPPGHSIEKTTFMEMGPNGTKTTEREFPGREGANTERPPSWFKDEDAHIEEARRLFADGWEPMMERTAEALLTEYYHRQSMELDARNWPRLKLGRRPGPARTEWGWGPGPGLWWRFNDLYTVHRVRVIDVLHLASHEPNAARARFVETVLAVTERDLDTVEKEVRMLNMVCKNWMPEADRRMRYELGGIEGIGHY